MIVCSRDLSVVYQANLHCPRSNYKKAMLQFCAQTNSSTFDDDEGVILSFHWGGRPIVIETDGDYFSGELVLATLHHGIIASNITMG